MARSSVRAITTSMFTSRRGATGLAASVLLAISGSTLGQTGFANFETPQASPVAVTPDGTRLLVVNTADARLEVFDISGILASAPRALASIPVGVDPVSVRARSSGEAWVVNHVSDSISVVDLASGRVVRTIQTGDEPMDVVFTSRGGVDRAWVTCSQLNQVRVWDLNNLSAAPSIVSIAGEDPRMLAASADGSKVYAAIFESANATTAIRQADVSNPAGPYGGQNPPPNLNATFDPPLAVGLPVAPPVGMIVKRNAAGQWLDDNGRNWSAFVTWNLADNDVAIIDSSTLSVSYAKGMLSTVMALGIKPDGTVTVVGSDATNEVRFEPNVRSTFVRIKMGSFDPAAPAGASAMDLNTHLLYDTESISPALRELSIGDPRGIVWNAAGTTGYISGMGSNSVIAVGPTGSRIGETHVGQGPTGLALGLDGSRLYVLNRFDATISTIETAGRTELSRVAFFDPTPQAIKTGRPFLYDTHLTSGLGQAACASCHIDGRSDFLAWDLGNPAGTVKTFNQNCRQPVCDNWHPMKGLMVTQSLQGIVGNGPMHWRGDRENLAAFAGAFVDLQGADNRPTPGQMQQMTNFVATIRYQPNPNRNIDDTLPASLPATGGTGNPAQGVNLYNTAPVLPGGVTCAGCHGPANGTGTNRQIDDPPNLPLAPQPLKMSQLRGLNEKLGWNRTSTSSNRGFGFNHHSEFDSLFALLGVGFNWAPGAQGLQQRRDVETFMLAFPTGTHPGVGQQITFDGTNNTDAASVARLNTFVTLAGANSVGLVAKGVQNGTDRGWMYNPAGLTMQSDRTGETVTPIALRSLAAAGSEITFTLVLAGTQQRIGIDRDVDGFFDGDERSACSDPASAASFPGARGAIDVNGDFAVNTGDIFAFLGLWFAGDLRADFDNSQSVDVPDIFVFLSAWFNRC